MDLQNDMLKLTKHNVLTLRFGKFLLYVKMKKKKTKTKTKTKNKNKKQNKTKKKTL